MADSNDVFLRELKQELEREKFERIWQRYGVYIIAGIVAIIVAVGAFQLWRAYNLTAAQESGAQYEAALEQAISGKLDEAAKGFEQIDAGPSGYAALADLQLAATHLEAGRRQEALAAYEKVAGDSGVDPLLSDFARLQAAAIQLGTADWTDLQNRLTDLTADGNAWRHSARELLGLAALEAGKTQEARELFEKLAADPQAPANVQERARLRLEAIVAADLKAPSQPADQAAAERRGPATGDQPEAADAQPAPDGSAKGQSEGVAK